MCPTGPHPFLDPLTLASSAPFSSLTLSSEHAGTQTAIMKNVPMEVFPSPVALTGEPLTLWDIWQ